MMNDSVREELQTKVTPSIAPRIGLRGEPTSLHKPMSSGPAMFTPPPASTAASQTVARPLTPSAGIVPPVKAPLPVISAPAPVRRQETAGLSPAKTSPTLVEFQTKNATLPDWRIELQNAVRQRAGGQPTNAVSSAAIAGSPQFQTNGGAALKAEVVQRREPEAAKAISDPRLASAMRRIEESRKAFHKAEANTKFIAPKPETVRPFGVVTPSSASPVISPMPTQAPARPVLTQTAMPKPTLVPSQPPIQTLKRDTNRLPRIEMAAASPVRLSETPAENIDSFDMIDDIEKTAEPTEFAGIKRIRIRAENQEIENVQAATEFVEDEIEDLAPFSMRFGAGLFDLIIGGFASMLVLSPIAFSNGNWFSAAGLLTFAATCAIVMFLYMTVCLGFSGKTLGMRLFSLELVDAAENEYPTMHQAAVNSAVYIISLIFGGAGFLTIFFNEEKRAAHDLLSGTILVREF